MIFAYEPHEQRVVAEKCALNEKLDSLLSFIEGLRFADLDADEQQRLRAQVIAMKTYGDILTERIGAFKMPEGYTA